MAGSLLPDEARLLLRRTHLVLSPTAFLRRLACLISPPRGQPGALLRCPRPGARLRPLVVPTRPLLARMVSQGLGLGAPLRRVEVAPLPPPRRAEPPRRGGERRTDCGTACTRHTPLTHAGPEHGLRPQSAPPTLVATFRRRGSGAKSTGGARPRHRRARRAPPWGVSLLISVHAPVEPSVSPPRRRGRSLRRRRSCDRQLNGAVDPLA